jgi:hypothetical protein
MYKHQYGFRAKHSTIHPIIHFLNSVAESNDLPTKDITLGLFLDLSKAIDTIKHTIPLKKVHHYGIRGIANQWFESYLKNRKQFTNIMGTNSSINTAECGVPQGSILGHGALYRTAPRTKFSANLPKHMYPQIWNNLPEATRNITSRKIFKNTIKANMLKEYNTTPICKNPLCPDCTIK